MKKKNLKSLKDFKDLNKEELIDKLMLTTIKGGCCDTGIRVTSLGKFDNDFEIE